MTTYICTPELNAFTDLDFEAAHQALLDGLPITCWWFSNSGKRHQETFIFTEYRYISSCSDIDG